MVTYTERRENKLNIIIITLIITLIIITLMQNVANLGKLFF